MKASTTYRNHRMASPVTVIRNRTAILGLLIFALGTYCAVASSVVGADGLTWSQQASGVTTTLREVSAYSSGLVVAVGDQSAGQPTALQYDGTSWGELPGFQSFASQASNWENVDQMYGALTLGPDNIWVASYTSNQGRLAVWDGDEWRNRSTGTSRRFTGLVGWVEDGDTLVLGGRINERVTTVAVPAGQDPIDDSVARTINLGNVDSNLSGTIWTVGGSGSDNMWAAGGGGDERMTFHSSDGGDTWSKRWEDADNSAAIFSLSPTLNWFGRGSDILFYDGNAQYDRVLMHTAPDTIRGIYATDENNVWAVGSSATLLYYDGDTWEDVDISGLDPSGTFFGITGTEGPYGTELWVVGTGGQIYHAIPEPGTLLLLGAGALALLAHRCRCRA